MAIDVGKSGTLSVMAIGHQLLHYYITGHQLLHYYITGHQLLYNDYITGRMSHPRSWVLTSDITRMYKVSVVIGLYVVVFCHSLLLQSM